MRPCRPVDGLPAPPSNVFQDALSTLIQGKFSQMTLACLDMVLFAWPFLFLCIIESWPGNMHRMANWRRRAKQLPTLTGMDAGEDLRAPNCTFLLFLLVPVLSFLQHISAPVMSRIKTFCSVSSSCPRLGILCHHSSKHTAFHTRRLLFLGLYSLKNRLYGRENHTIRHHLLCWFQGRYLICLHSAPFNLYALSDKEGYINSFPAPSFHR